jgi:hypothetical protein
MLVEILVVTIVIYLIYYFTSFYGNNSGSGGISPGGDTPGGGGGDTPGGGGGNTPGGGGGNTPVVQPTIVLTNHYNGEFVSIGNMRSNVNLSYYEGTYTPTTYSGIYVNSSTPKILFVVYSDNTSETLYYYGVFISVSSGDPKVEADAYFAKTKTTSAIYTLNACLNPKTKSFLTASDLSGLELYDGIKPGTNWATTEDLNSLYNGTAFGGNVSGVIITPIGVSSSTITF